MAQEFNLRASDTFGLISAIGRDCAGAVVIQPDTEPKPSPPSTLTAEPLSEGDIEQLVANLRTAPLGAGERVRVSLGGVQEKLLLTRLPDGSWGRPVNGTASTHILKPEIARFPATVENEAFCLRVASNLDLPVATVDTIKVSGRKLLAVERFDRVVSQDGTVQRIHQEDLCQATGTPPERKYEEDGGPSLRAIANLVQAAAAPGALEVLLRAVTVNSLLGNGDAHAKNFSLLHHASGALGLCPLYDLLCTSHYGDDRLALFIDDVHRTNRVTATRIVNEATRWGLSRARATAVVEELLEHAPEAISLAQAATADLPEALVATVHAQLGQLTR